MRVEVSWSVTHGRRRKHPPEELSSIYPCASLLLGLGESKEEFQLVLVGSSLHSV